MVFKHNPGGIISQNRRGFMAYPKETEIELPLLEEIEKAGGQVRPQDVYARVASHFPQLTAQDLERRMKSSPSTYKWHNYVQWVRQTLVEKGEIDGSVRGIWKITDLGRKRVGASASGISTAPTRPHDSLTPAVHEGERTHGMLKRKIKEIGEIVGRYAQEEYAARPYIYDVIWKDIEGLPRPSHVFEVQDKGAVDSALAKLQHARDMWKPNLFLVVTGERDQRKVSMLLEPFFEGAFHSLRRDTIVLTAEAINDIHHAFTEHREVIGHFLEA